MDFRPRSVRIKTGSRIVGGATNGKTKTDINPSFYNRADSASLQNGSSNADHGLSKEEDTQTSKPSTGSAVSSRPHQQKVVTTLTPVTTETDSEERERLEYLLWTMETCLGDWGLSTYRSSGMLEKVNSCGEKGVHIQHILNLPPIQALTSIQADIQKAIRIDSRPKETRMLKLSPSGYHVVRQEQTDFDILDGMKGRDWDKRTLYLENIPSLPGQRMSPPLLSHLLSVMFKTRILNLVFPLLHDPYSSSSAHDRLDTSSSQDSSSDTEDQPEDSNSHSDTDSDSETDTSSSSSASGSHSASGSNTESIKKGDKILPSNHDRSSIDKGRMNSKQGRIPRGGGPFKGFAFIIVQSENDGEGLVKGGDWNWRGGESTNANFPSEKDQSLEEGTSTTYISRASKTSFVKPTVAENEQNQEEDQNSRKDLKIGQEDVHPRFKNLAKQHGLQVLSLLLEEAEYLKRKTRRDRERRFEGEEDAGAGSWHGKHSDDHQLHDGHWEQQDDFEVANESLLPSSRKRKSFAAVTNPKGNFESQEEDLGDASLGSDSRNKGSRQTSKRPRLSNDSYYPDTLGGGGEIASGGRASSGLTMPQPSSFPEGCVLWIRNLHEKSTRSSLRTTFSSLLESLEEGSGTGIEFVDYEKGLDNCHLRFSSSHLASVVLDFLDRTLSVHGSPTLISPIDPNKPTAPGLIIKVKMLEGERERVYWEGLPDSTRRGASRKSVGGSEGLVGGQTSGGDQKVVQPSTPSSAAQIEIVRMESQDSVSHQAKESLEEPLTRTDLPDGGGARPRKKPSRL